MMFTPDLHSYAYIIRAGWIDRIKAVPTFQSIKRFGLTKMNRVQPEHIPYLGCYLIDEQLRPIGDPNAGEPRFYSEMKVGFSVMIENSNDEVAEDNLDSCYWTMMNLLTNPGWHRFKLPPPWDPVHIEGIVRGSRRHVFGNTALNNETRIAELQFDLTFKQGFAFEPGPFVDLNRIHVTVAYPWPYDPNANQPPFVVQYDLLQDKSTQPYDLDPPDFATPRLNTPLVDKP